MWGPMGKRQSTERAQRRAMKRAMAKAERQQRKPVPPRPAPNPLLKPEAGGDPLYEETSGRGQALVGEVMLAGCPCFTAKWIPGRGVAVVDEARVRPTVCDACGCDPNHVFNTGECPRLIDQQTAMALLLPPDVLHAEPEESGLLMP